MSKKHNVRELDASQLDMMWNFLRIGGQRTDSKDVTHLIEAVDAVRQIMVQKTGGMRKDDPREYIDSRDLGTYINMIVCYCLALRLSGALDKLWVELHDEEQDLQS